MEPEPKAKQELPFVTELRRPAGPGLNKLKCGGIRTVPAVKTEVRAALGIKSGTRGEVCFRQRTEPLGVMS